MIDRRQFLSLGATTVATTSLSACEGVSPGRPPVEMPLTRPTGVDDASWAHVRAQFILDRGVTYMNNASLGMPPKRVVDAVASGYEAISREPLHGKHDLQEKIAERVMPLLARMFGVSSNELVLTRNASEALHLQSIGLIARPGDEILITTQEHPAGRQPWMFRKTREGLRVREVFIPSPLVTPEDVIQRVQDAITARTRAVAFCHVTRGGHLYPVRELCAMARSRQLTTLVDGAQAVGQFPIDISTLGCDAYAVSLHKWMLAPAGTGFLFVRDDARDRIRSAFSADATTDAPAFGPPGTAPFPVYAAIAEALEFVQAIGLEQIASRCRYLSDYLKNQLVELDGVRILSGRTNESSAPGSTIFEKQRLDAIESVALVERGARTHIDEHQRDGHNAIRVSTHIYNTVAEIDRLIETLASV